MRIVILLIDSLRADHLGCPNSFSGHFSERREVRLNDDTPPVFRDWVKEHDNSF